MKLIEMHVKLKQQSAYQRFVPTLLKSANSRRGLCQAAQMRPLRRQVFVYDIRFASSGTRNPRQPISSPKVIEAFCIMPPVATHMMARLDEAQSGHPLSPRPWATNPTNSEFHSPRCNAQAAPYAKEIYING